MKYANIPLPAGATHNAPVLIVVHAMGEYIDTDGRDYFAVDYLKKLGLSYHIFITPSGVAIKCREFTEGAYHAKGHNTNTLGTCFMVPGLHTYESFLEAIDKKYLTDAAFKTGLEVVREYLNRIPNNPEPREVIRTHAELSPGRKFDPGKGFPYSDFLDSI